MEQRPRSAWGQEEGREGKVGECTGRESKKCSAGAGVEECESDLGEVTVVEHEADGVAGAERSGQQKMAGEDIGFGGRFDGGYGEVRQVGEGYGCKSRRVFGELAKKRGAPGSYPVL